MVGILAREAASMVQLMTRVYGFGYAHTFR